MYRDISSIAVAVQICTCDKRRREESPDPGLMYAELPNYRFMLRCTTWTDILSLIMWSAERRAML